MNDIKTSRMEMLDAVMRIIDERGFGAVSARTVATELGISTQPIYREFGDMEALKAAATERGYEIFAEYMNADALEQSVRYVRFAAEKSNLFDFLFRGKRYEYDGLDDLSHKIIEDIGIIDKLESITGLARERVYRLHLCLWMALYGLAAMSCDNRIKTDDVEIKELVGDMTSALSAYYKNGGKA